MKLVTIFSTFSAGEAEMVRSRLEAAEFDVTLANDLSTTLAPGGVLIQVPEQQAEEARALLESPGDSAA